MAPDQGAEERSARRTTAQNGQLVPALDGAKVLGTPAVFVEALDADGAIVVERVESEVALLWPFVHREVVYHKKGKSEDNPVQLPKQIGQDILALLLEYCRYHRFPGRSDKERKLFDERFIRLDTRRLCELTSAADALDMKPLVDLSSRALARMIEGKTPEEIRETFHLPDDLTEEEKLEPVRNLADDPRIRLLNRLYAKKRKELAEKKAELLRRESGHPESERPAAAETRSVEELLSFIGEGSGGGGGGSGKAAGGDKKKKKAKRRKEPPGSGKRSPPTEAHPADAGEADGTAAAGERDGDAAAAAAEAELAEAAGLDGDSELDDEIEAFERSLNADWEERRAELIRMAGAYQPRPTRVTTLTSLSGFRAAPLDAGSGGGGEPGSPSWETIWAEGRPGEAADAPRPAEPRNGTANGGEAAHVARQAAASGSAAGAATKVDAEAAARLLARFVEQLGLSSRIRVELRTDGGEALASLPAAEKTVSVEGAVEGLGQLRLLRPPRP